MTTRTLILMLRAIEEALREHRLYSLVPGVKL